MGKGATRQGKITSGIRSGTIVQRTIEFIYSQLPLWRDDPDRPQTDSEEDLNGQLCKFLNATSNDSFPMVIFHHEERQTGRRRVDLSAASRTPICVGPRRHTIYDPFLVLEGKRLPAPSRNREREYVTGGETKSGGIQRFKLGLHGEKLGVAAMIGYVQSQSTDHWFATVNIWLDELAASDEDGTRWEPDERLQKYTPDTLKYTSICQSAHSRMPVAAGRTIRLFHLWIEI